MRSRPKIHGKQLPVSAHPAVQAGDGHFIMRGEFLKEFDIGDECRAREEPFEQVVAEQCIFGNASFERGLDRVDGGNSFADVRAFFEKILIHVRHGKGVRVNACRPRINFLIERAKPERGKAGCDARLHDAVAFNYAARFGPSMNGRLSGWAMAPIRR